MSIYFKSSTLQNTANMTHVTILNIVYANNRFHKRESMWQIWAQSSAFNKLAKKLNKDVFVMHAYIDTYIYTLRNSRV